MKSKRHITVARAGGLPSFTGKDRTLCGIHSDNHEEKKLRFVTCKKCKHFYKKNYKGD